MFSKVDLPAPLAPMMATASPAVDGEVDAEHGLEVAVAHVDVRELEHPVAHVAASTSLPR